MEHEKLEIPLQRLSDAISERYSRGSATAKGRNLADGAFTSGSTDDFAAGYRKGYLESHELTMLSIFGIGAFWKTLYDEVEESMLAFVDSMGGEIQDQIHAIRSYISNLDKIERAFFIAGMGKHCRRMAEMREEIEMEKCKNDPHTFYGLH